MTNFRVGMMVVYVGLPAELHGVTRDNSKYGVAYLTKNAIYTVRDVDARFRNPGIRVAEVVNPLVPHAWGDAEAAYHPASFRPVQYSTTKAVEALKASLPKLKIRERVE